GRGGPCRPRRHGAGAAPDAPLATRPGPRGRARGRGRTARGGAPAVAEVLGRRRGPGEPVRGEGQGPMTDEQALWAAIRATPEDDRPRLAYADWLEEAGRPEHANFVRAEVELARLVVGSPEFEKRYTVLSQRRLLLLYTHVHAWQRELQAALPETDAVHLY